MNNSANVYHSGSQGWQKVFGTKGLADRQVDLLYHDEVTAEEKKFIESRDMFFIATADDQGRPTCSYKGGPVGFVRVLDDRTIAFPDYDGNGMFLTVGNIDLNNEVGLLFIDFESPHRLRVHGVATVSNDVKLIEEFEGAQLVVRIQITEMFINCSRYIQHYKKVETSRFTPEPGKESPVPDWKYLEEVQDVLPLKDKARVIKKNI